MIRIRRSSITRQGFSIIIFAIAVILFAQHARAERLVDYVDPFIGTGGDGFGVGSAFPGPSLPFGMVKPGPDTSTDGKAPGFYHCAGYYYKDKQIRGFSHNRMHGTGVADYGNIMLMPATGDPLDMAEEKNYVSNFSHKSETARVGYYSVELKRTGITAEMTSAEYTAHHRHTFPAGATQALVILNAGHFIGEGTPVETVVDVDAAKGEASGYFDFRGGLGGRDGGVKTYFVLKAKSPIGKYWTWADGKFTPGAASVKGKTAGAVLDFGAPAGPVEIKVAISYISVEQARANMVHDGEGWDFAATRAKAEAAWEKLLGRVVVEGGTADQKKMFYTGVYHSMLMPTQQSEAGGWFLGFDRKPHKAEGFKYYTDFSMWDTFRTLHPLLTLIAPEYERDMVVSLLEIYKYGGFIPKWPLGAAYTNCMIGTPADVVIADTYLKGITNFDVELAYKGLRDTATAPPPPGSRYSGRGGIEDYIKLGYVPSDKNGSATSDTLEYAFEDYAISRLAGALGKKEDEAMFLARSQNYRNVWNPKAGFMDGRRSDGTFAETLNPLAWLDFYTEGDAWQWAWFAPHDVDGLIELMGGREAFINKLDEFFSRSHKSPDSMMPDKWYWHGNEPDIYSAYWYLHAARPDRAQEEIRWIMNKKYSAKPGGIDGNDDGGTMSSWYVLSALGIFPIPATNRYYIGSPVFGKATVKLNNGKEIVITAKGADEKNLYVDSASFNGKPIVEPFVTHERLVAGAQLDLTMSPSPGAWLMKGK